MKRIISLLLVCALILVTGCATNDPSKNEGTQVSAEKTDETGKSKEIPTLTMSWGNELHTGIMNIPIKNVEAFKNNEVYFNPLSEEQFELIKDGEKIALVNFIKTKGGSEAATLMGQGHLDVAVCSNTAMLSAYDAGTKVKILSPIQTDGIGLVFGNDKNFKNWEDIKAYILSSELPVKLGYHSPVSGPRIVLESVLRNEGIKTTEDPNNTTADVLLVDLKGSQNLLPALTSKQVDGWVGPSHYPETAEYQKIGKIALQLEDFPPVGKWENFPCCVFAATEEAVAKYPEVMKALVQLITDDAKYCTEHKDEAAVILSEAVGVEEGAIKLSKIKYTTNPTDKWVDGIKIYFDSIQEMGKFEGKLKDAEFNEVIENIFYFEYANESN